VEQTQQEKKPHLLPYLALQIEVFLKTCSPRNKPGWASRDIMYKNMCCTIVQTSNLLVLCFQLYWLFRKLSLVSHVELFWGEFFVCVAFFLSECKQITTPSTERVLIQWCSAHCFFWSTCISS